ncbi:hypothetical protein EDC56_2225 [Sinobacterium caligoides]|uniref:Uncharacterized protein n=1 Tax=Sinobacterium caligoides TaxID=933926 RepID=A0A3N2DPR9_9GAMM|nr:hypothetical protein [Sinobacterium caligoides]ROS01780.1 hypothetical protein EDC56_2225 [Sinobacterium caligoides]
MDLEKELGNALACSSESWNRKMRRNSVEHSCDVVSGILASTSNALNTALEIVATEQEHNKALLAEDLQDKKRCWEYYGLLIEHKRYIKKSRAVVSESGGASKPEEYYYINLGGLKEIEDVNTLDKLAMCDDGIDGAISVLGSDKQSSPIVINSGGTYTKEEFVTFVEGQQDLALEQYYLCSKTIGALKDTFDYLYKNILHEKYLFSIFGGKDDGLNEKKSTLQQSRRVLSHISSASKLVEHSVNTLIKLRMKKYALYAEDIAPNPLYATYLTNLAIGRNLLDKDNENKDVKIESVNIHNVDNEKKKSSLTSAVEGYSDKQGGGWFKYYRLQPRSVHYKNLLKIDQCPTSSAIKSAIDLVDLDIKGLQVKLNDLACYGLIEKYGNDCDTLLKHRKQCLETLQAIQNLSKDNVVQLSATKKKIMTAIDQSELENDGLKALYDDYIANKTDQTASLFISPLIVYINSKNDDRNIRRKYAEAINLWDRAIDPIVEANFNNALKSYEGLKDSVGQMGLNGNQNNEFKNLCDALKPHYSEARNMNRESGMLQSSNADAICDNINAAIDEYERSYLQEDNDGRGAKINGANRVAIIKRLTTLKDGVSSWKSAIELFAAARMKNNSVKYKDLMEQALKQWTSRFRLSLKSK